MMASGNSDVEPRSHYVQFCTDATLLARNVAAYLAEGLRLGESVVIVARPERREPFERAMREEGEHPELLLAEGRLVRLDARETLARFMTPEGPDWVRFDDVLGAVVRDLKLRSSGVRAYGEMVDLLWCDGNAESAVRLEEHWNRLIQREGFSLYCNYGLDLLDSNVLAGDLEMILSRHSHAHGHRPHRQLQQAVDQALIDVLGAEALEALGPLIRTTRYPRPVLGGPEAALLWVRRHLPAQTREILARARAHVATAGAS